ncbi:MAG: alpha/beta hydrolase [bacterium]|nr:alpha/beta hydrolase [bacterium]
MKKPTIIFLHGWGGSKTSMQPLVDRLLNIGPTLVFDLPGFGAADPPEKPWDVDDYVRWLHRRCVEKNIEHVVLVGHSFGGHIACRFAAAHPSMVLKLVLLAPSGIRQPLSKRQSVAHLLTQLARNVPFPEISFIRSLIHLLAGERDYLRASPVMRSSMQKVLAQDVRDVLSKIKVKTLIVWGKDDHITPVANAEIFEKGIKHSKLVILDGARHGIPFTQTKEVAESVRRFLNEVT